MFAVHHYFPAPITWAKETGHSDWQRTKSPYRGPHGKAISIIPKSPHSCSGQCLNLAVDYHKWLAVIYCKSTYGVSYNLLSQPY